MTEARTNLKKKMIERDRAKVELMRLDLEVKLLMIDYEEEVFEKEILSNEREREVDEKYKADPQG